MIGYAYYNETKVKEMLDAEINKKPSDRTDYMKTYKEKKEKGEITTTPVVTTTTTKKKKK